jgi:hypothetical protein
VILEMILESNLVNTALIRIQILSIQLNFLK